MSVQASPVSYPSSAIAPSMPSSAAPNSPFSFTPQPVPSIDTFSVQNALKAPASIAPTTNSSTLQAALGFTPQELSLIRNDFLLAAKAEAPTATAPEMEAFVNASLQSIVQSRQFLKQASQQAFKQVLGAGNIPMLTELAKTPEGQSFMRKANLSTMQFNANNIPTPFDSYFKSQGWI
jgi:hypothetical protein